MASVRIHFTAVHITKLKAQGVEAPIWFYDSGFVTITFKRPDLESDTIETRKVK